MEISRCVWQQGKVFGGVRRRVGVRAIEYSDRGHMRYYSSIRNKKSDFEYCLNLKTKTKKEKKKIEEKQKKMRKHDSSSSSSSSESSSDEDCRTSIGAVAPMAVEESRGMRTSIGAVAPMAVEERRGMKTSIGAVAVEVCMGNKCKKMGAESLMAELQQQSPATVVLPCKCMGKCKSAPNVRTMLSTIN